MKTTLFSALLIAAGLLLAGCEDKKPAAPIVGAGGPTTQPATDAGALLNKAITAIAHEQFDEADALLAQVEASNSSLSPLQRERLATARESLANTRAAKAATGALTSHPALPATIPAVPNASAVPGVPATPGGDKVQQAQDLLAKATAFISEKKWTDADATLKQLEDLKPQLPANLQDRITQTRTAYAAAKTAAGWGDTVIGK